MWFLTLLLAFMASGGFACHDDHCQCYPAAQTVQVTCTGKLPTLDHLPHTIRKLNIASAMETEVRTFLDNFDNSSLGLISLEEIVLTNCSLKNLNVSWSGLEQVRELNLSHNMFVDVSDVVASDAQWLCNVTVLDLSSNQISDIGDEELRTFGGLTWLRISDNGLWNVSDLAFSGLSVLEVLDLSDNKLATLPNNALTPLESLQKLDLSGNQLRALGARWFETLGRLRELDVSRNGISRAASGVLQPLPGLSILRLSENPLRERDVSLLLGTGRRLETVDASHTGLVRVPAALTRSVRALRLAGNKLTSISGGDLDSYPLLRLLDLSDNRLTVVEDDALGRLEVLEVLNLSGNFLAIVPHSLPTSLTQLHLERNTISILRFGDFDGLYNLRILKINNNRIESIEEGSFSQLPTLEELSVSNNPIKALPANTFSGLTNLMRLQLSGLGSLSREEQKQRDMAFPVPTPERLTTLDVSRSPVLAAQLLTDDAALSACRSLTELNLAHIDITTIRSDLVYDLPQLRRLGLAGNDWNCTTELYWLGEWIRQHGELDEPARCTEPSHLIGYHLSQMPNPPIQTSISPPIKPTANSTHIPNFPSTVNNSKTPTLKKNTITTTTTSLSSVESPFISNVTEIPKINRQTSYLKLKSKKQKSGKNYINSAMRKENVKISNKVLDKTKILESESRTEDENDHHDSKKYSQLLNGKMGGTKEKDVPLSNDVSNTVAQELSGQVTDSGARVTDALSAGAHPGMLVLVGAALGAAAALTVVLSRRAAPIRRRDQYQRQENIEVHSLTSTIERW